MIYHKFKIGDVVYLNSNPKLKMVVSGFVINGQIEVTYFRRGNIRSTSKFEPDILTLYKKLK